MSVMADTEAPISAAHIRLICWDHHHEQAWSREQLRLIRFAPICSAFIDGQMCGSLIWAVQHEGEPTRYLGRPPHRNWERWADCIEEVTADGD